MRLVQLAVALRILLRCCSLTEAASSKSAPKFLLISAPQMGKVSYVRLNAKGQAAAEAQILIQTGLVHPQGLAVDSARKRLYVAEPEARKVFMYNITRHDDRLSVGPQEVAAEGIEARWVATDAVGNLLFTDEPANQVMQISAESLQRGHRLPEALFSGSSTSSVSAPGGVATDGINTFWVNKALGSHMGSVVSALQHASRLQAAGTRALANNVEKSYGICLAMNNIFYTQPENSIFAVKRNGGTPTLISDKLSRPRGCAWDGENTVYVADRAANAVYAFPGGVQTLSALQLSVAARAEDAFGLAIFSAATRLQSGMLLLTPLCLWLALTLAGAQDLAN